MTIQAALSLGIAAGDIDGKRGKNDDEVTSTSSSNSPELSEELGAMVQISLMASTSFKLLPMQVAEAKKQEVKKLAERVMSIQNKIGLETTFRDTAITFASFGSQNATQIKNTQEELNLVDKKIKRLMNDLMNTTSALIKVERSYLKHLIAVLRWEVKESSQTTSSSNTPSLPASKEKIADAQSQIVEQKDLIDKLKSELEKVQSSHSPLVKELDELKRSTQNILSEKESLEKSLKRTEVRLKEQEDVNKIRNSKKLSDIRPKSKTDFTMADYNRLKLDLASARSDLESSQQDVTASRENIARLENAVADKTGTIETKDNIISHLLSAIENASIQLESVASSSSPSLILQVISSLRECNIKHGQQASNKKVDGNASTSFSSAVAAVKFTEPLKLEDSGGTLKRQPRQARPSPPLFHPPVGDMYPPFPDALEIDSHADTLRITPNESFRQARDHFGGSGGTLRRNGGIKLMTSSSYNVTSTNNNNNNDYFEVSKGRPDDSDTDTEDENDNEFRNSMRQSSSLAMAAAKDSESIRSSHLFDESSDVAPKSGGGVDLRELLQKLAAADGQIELLKGSIGELEDIKERLYLVQTDLENTCSNAISPTPHFNADKLVFLIRKANNERIEANQRCSQLQQQLHETGVGGGSEDAASQVKDLLHVKQSLEEELGSLNDMLNEARLTTNELRAREESYLGEASMVQKTLEAIKAERDNLSEKCLLLEEEIARLSSLSSSHVHQQARPTLDNDQEANHLREELARIKAEALENEGLFISQAREIESRHASQMQELREQNNLELRQQQQKQLSVSHSSTPHSPSSSCTVHEEEITRLSKQLEQETAARSKSDDKIQEIMDSHKMDIDKMNQQHRAELEKLRSGGGVCYRGDGEESCSTLQNDAHVEEIGRLQMSHIHIMENMEQSHLVEINELQQKIKRTVDSEIEAERGRCQLLMRRLEDEVRELEREKDETVAKLRISQEEVESVIHQFRQLEQEMNSREDDHRVSRLQAEYDAELMDKDQRLFQYHEENQMLIKQLEEMEAHFLQNPQLSKNNSDEISSKQQQPHSDDELLMEIDRLQRTIIQLKERNADLMEELEDSRSK